MRAFTDEEVLQRVSQLPTFTGFPNGVLEVWIRSTADEFDSFDDKAFTYECYGNTKKPKFIMARNGTTNAGSYGLKNFAEYNHKGCAVLKSDTIIYDSHVWGLHKKKDAYRQVKGFPYFRDNNKNNRAEEIGTEYNDVILANVHRAGVNSTVIKDWSTACLVTANLQKFFDFLAYMKSKGKPPLTVCILKEWPADAPAAPAKLNRKFFFDNVRLNLFGGALKESQVQGLEAILNEWDKNWAGKDDRWLAYMFATVHHETDRKFAGIEEYGPDSYFKKYDGRLDLGNTQPGDGLRFKGRGFVQITGRANYTKYTGVLGVDLVKKPELALELKHCVQIMFHGMATGGFTGKKLGDYFKGNTADWINARRIINKLDKANLIADYAKQFYAAISYTT